MKAAVETRDLTKRFGNSYALAGLTMTVPRGTWMGFLPERFGQDHYNKDSSRRDPSNVR